MVGVPGRFRGCITCRKRKKGCDRRTPACDRCIRARLSCEGYETDMIWLNSTTSITVSNRECCDPPQLKTVPDIRPWIVSYARRREIRSRIILPDSFARSAREQLYFGIFWSIMIPDGPQFSQKSSDLASVGWTKFIGDLYNSETALRYATIATAACILGKLNDDEQLRVKGLQVYNWTIQEMIKAVKEPSRAKSDSLVLAARVMSFYELFSGPDGDPGLTGWQRHSEGQLAMFLIRGPHSFLSGGSHQLFVDSRINIFLLAIKQRAVSPFSSNEWKTVPWTVVEKSTKDKLIDVMSSIPEIITHYDALAKADSQDAANELREIISQKCQEAGAALATWQDHIDLSIYDYTIAGLPLPTPQADSDFSLLHLSCVFWSNCLMLSCIMHSISGDSQMLKALLGRKTNCSPEEFASKMVNCGHLFFEPLAGAVQGSSGFFPMVCAWRFYELAAELSGEKSAELQTLYDLFEKPFMGSQVGKYLAHLQRSIWDDDSNAYFSGKAGFSKFKNWTAWF